MGQSLDKVLQPDGTYKWQMVDISEANGIVPVGPDGKPVVAKAEPPAKPARKSKSKVEPTKVEAPIESAPEA